MTRIAALCALLVSVTTANASPPLQQNPPAPPCAAAVQQFCADVAIGEGRRIACLAKHKANLTPACRERVSILQKMFAFGQQQKAKTEAYLAKHDPEGLKELRAETARGAPPPPTAAPHK